MREISTSDLLIAATGVFVSGIIVFYIIFSAMNLVLRLQETIGIGMAEEESARIMFQLQLIPPIFFTIYAVIVGVIIYFFIIKKKDGGGQDLTQEDLYITQMNQRSQNYGQQYSPPKQNSYLGNQQRPNQPYRRN